MRPMVSVLCSAVFAVVLLAFPSTARAADTDVLCQLNTGLDPGCPITEFGLANTTETLENNSTLHSDTVFGSYEWHGNQEVYFDFPIRDHLMVDTGRNIYGVGSFNAHYTHTYRWKHRLVQTVGLSTELPIGGKGISDAHSSVSPIYNASFVINRGVSLLAICQYVFYVGGPYPGGHRLFVTPRAIFNLSKNGYYTSVDVQSSNIAGDARFRQYQTDGVFGFASGRYNISATYGVPISTTTRQHVLYHVLEFQFSFR